MSSQRIHLIAIGGSAMHNFALALSNMGHHVTGSDDEVYEPSRSRLEKAGLLPEKMGWHPENITDDIDYIILGMHAKVDNPELLRAQELGIKIYSYPEYLAKMSKDKKRVVVAGSHGKTTTTAIIMHVLKYHNIDFDYMVGAQLEGFDRMVKLSDAPLIIIEGDEYLSSPIDRRPKMLHYKPHLAIITGVAWDHINVFPTEKEYNKQFELFVDTIDHDGKLFYYKFDDILYQIIRENHHVPFFGYTKAKVNENKCVEVDGKEYKINLVGNHNYQNIKGAQKLCIELGISKPKFFEALESFTGAAKRLQLLKDGHGNKGNVYLDFAHAPSKVKATTAAVKDHYQDEKLTAILELHTFSSLNGQFLPTYKGTLDKADVAYVYCDEHTLQMKNMPKIDPWFLKSCFSDKVIVIQSKEELQEVFDTLSLEEGNILLMSSGKFGGLSLDRFRD